MRREKQVNGLLKYRKLTQLCRIQRPSERTICRVFQMQLHSTVIHISLDLIAVELGTRDQLLTGMFSEVVFNKQR